MDVRITRIGARGDGIAETPDGAVYVPGTVAGDLVEIRIAAKRGDGRAAELLRVVEPGPARRDPDCGHFGVCGGCALQHVGADAYLDWKRDRVAEALRQNGLSTEIAGTVSVPPGSRRRVRFAFRLISGRMIVGFRAAKSDRLVDLRECPVTRPEIVALLAPLRGFLARHAGAGEVAVTASATGFDVVVFADRDATLDARLDAPGFCAEAGIARLSWAGKVAGARGAVPELLLALRPVGISFGPVEVELPADAFLQPTAEGEAALRDAVLGVVGDAQRILDLYAGCGAFALPLAHAGRIVHAVEGVAAQTRAIVRANSNVSTETRDIARQPLRPEELARFDAVILDPPRSGAAEQTAEIAASRVPCIAYVSCNPATFARDARVLVDAGYRLGRVLPVDQFLWSHHVELVAAFSRS